MARIKDLKGLTDSGYWDSIWKKVKKLPAVNTKTSFVDKQISTIIQKEIIDKPNVKICQLGCGTGKWLKFLVENITKISEIWGLDFAPSAVELSIKNLKSTKTNIPFHVISGDILSLPAPFNGKTFDFIFSIGVFEHFFNWEEVIKLSSLCLKPGGKMLTVIPNLEGLNGLIMKRFNPQSYARHIVISPEELERAYKKTGFGNVEVYYIGVMSLTSISWRGFCFNSEIIEFAFRNFVLISLNLIVRIILKLLRRTKTRFFSPMLIATGNYYPPK